MNHSAAKKYIPSGVLSFRREGYYGERMEWKEGKNSLEEQLPAIITKLELKARAEKKEKEEREESHRKWMEQERIRNEQKELKLRELEKFKDLIEEVNHWHQAILIREYANFIETKSKRSHNDQEDWVSWAKAKADWYDPMIGKEDEILGTYTPSYNVD